MPTFLAIKGDQGVVDTLKGADPQGLTNLIARHAGPNPPVAPLPPKAEEAKAKGTEAFKKGEWAAAVELYGEAIKEAVGALPRRLGKRSLTCSLIARHGSVVRQPLRHSPQPPLLPFPCFAPLRTKPCRTRPLRRSQGDRAAAIMGQRLGSSRRGSGRICSSRRRC